MSRWLLIRLEPAGPSGFESCGGTLLALAIILGIPGALLYHGCNMDGHVQQEEAQQQQQQQKQKQAVSDEHDPMWGIGVVHPRPHMTKNNPSLERNDYARWLEERELQTENRYLGHGEGVVLETSGLSPDSPAGKALLGRSRDVYATNTGYASINYYLITAVDGTRVYSVSQFKQIVKHATGKTLTLSLQWGKYGDDASPSGHEHADVVLRRDY